MSFMCNQQMLDYGLNEQSAKEMKARVLKHMTEMVLPILMEPTDPSDNRSQEVGNVFNRFATALLQGCEDLDANEVWLYTCSVCTCILP